MVCWPHSTPKPNADEVQAVVERVFYATDLAAREKTYIDSHIEAGCACAAAKSPENRAHIEVVGNMIHSGMAAFAEHKFTTEPDLTVDEGHLHLVVRHGFKAGGHTYTLTLRQES